MAVKELELKEPHLIGSDHTLSGRDGSGPGSPEFGLARAVAVGRYIYCDLAAAPCSARQNGRFQYVSGKRRIRVDVMEDPELER